MLKKQVSPKIVAIVFAVIVVCFAIAVYVSAWTEPTAVPPGANVSAPLNTSLEGQTKQGNLVVNALGINAAGNALLVPNGNVGIGAITPGRKLEVEGSSDYEGIRLRNTGIGGDRWDILSMSGAAVNPGGLTFWNGTHRMVIDGLGNVGIGTDAPSTKLDVSGNINAQGYIEFGSGNIRLAYKSGASPTCSKLTMVRHFTAKTCDSNDPCPNPSCSINAGWSSTAKTCSYQKDGAWACMEETCAASWNEAICLD
ncbi:MAG: hypothetical protein A2V72_00920 [Candidatus Nealsonbacteria bacterium RBG_13_37_56]|uniref:Uncharacterized protein n=1 Tax=Candidatus Nealsonbacteria bacterium RBG_13_37_56 TaxID=1801661 RepID=A0A1G2DY40_9BACT|nr:MAG: hypothetical protein A2V72_00920 [Candidatus Nealsonbacteria bacterium RBG_13_37_56]